MSSSVPNPATEAADFTSTVTPLTDIKSHAAHPCQGCCTASNATPTMYSASEPRVALVTRSDGSFLVELSNPEMMTKLNELSLTD